MFNKKIIIFILFFAFIKFSFSQDEIKELVVLHTGDIHSHIESFRQDEKIKYFDASKEPESIIYNDKKGADKDISSMGGLAKLSTLVNSLKSENTLLIDAGDLMQGTPYYNFFGGEVEVKILNEIGYEYFNIGNHEFDQGISELYKSLKLAKFKIISSNYDFTKTPLNKIIRTYDVIIKNGIKIGIFGLGPNPKGLIPKKHIKGLIFKDPISSAKKMVNFLRNKKNVDVVICISHLGLYSKKENDYMTRSDIDIAKNVSGIDLITGGHTLMEHPIEVKKDNGSLTIINHSGYWGIYIARVILKIKDHKVIGYSG
jgi:5'-nucleotidase